MPLSRHCRYGVLLRHTQERRPGYLDTFDVCHQVFYRDHLLSLGRFTLKLWRDELYREEIPQDVLIEKGAFGTTSWTTSCPDEFFDKCDQRIQEAA